MVYLLAPPRIVFFPGTALRVMRGGGGSLIFHACLVAALSFGAGSAGTAALGPRVTLMRTLPLPAASATPRRRERETPFHEQADEQPPATIPLTVRNHVTGDEFRIDLARIRRRRNDLFPFVTWDLRVFAERPSDGSSTGIAFPSAYVQPVPGDAEPLSLSPGALQALVDRAWSRRERWSNLAELVALTDRYDPDRGDLPLAVRGYVTTNVPQPYGDWGIADPVFWIVLTLAADDAPLVEFATAYLRRHPASRVTTELLFLLDNSAESSCDVLQRVLNVGSDNLPLDVTRRDNPEAYELATSLAWGYRAWLRRYSVNPTERCVAARTAMLRRIIDTSPGRYGAGDARVRLGTMLWMIGRKSEAADWWRGIEPDERDVYAQVARRLRGAVEDGAAEHHPARINGILLEEEQRWRESATERLDYFGWSPTRF